MNKPLISERMRKMLYPSVLAATFLLMFGCNLLTKYLVDDFRYLYSFADWSRIEHFGQILPSMAAHARTMNGRLTAHSLVQVFALFLGWGFDIVNAMMAAGLVWIVERFTRNEETPSPLLAAVIFCGIWVFQPSFGQVMLWQDGAVNYLWSVCFGLPLIYLAGRACLYDALPRRLPGRIGMLVLAYVAGSYLESTSLAVIVCLGLLILVRKCLLRKPVSHWVVAALVIAAVGYMTIYLAPAQWQNKAAGLSPSALIRNFVTATQMLRRIGGLILAFGILMVVTVTQKLDPRQIAMAGILATGSLTANYIHTAAAVYPERSTVAVVALLVCADAILLRLVLSHAKLRVLGLCLAVVMLLMAAPLLVSGVHDIAVTYVRVQNNENWILQQAAQGKQDIEVHVFTPITGYSPAYNLKYLDTEDPESWPNNSMARYYGVHSIIGN